MPANDETSRAVRRVLAALAERGLLLKQDLELPNVVTLVTGDRPRTSWWSHPRGRLVFAVLTRLADHEDVLFTKLLSSKVTLVHRRLWPVLLAVGRERADWQTRRLSTAARRMLAKAGEGEQLASGAAVKELEARLLVHVEEVHTDSGKHALCVEDWSAWARRRGVRALRRDLEDAAAALGATREALPWSRED
jgi:hypothetical protein